MTATGSVLDPRAAGGIRSLIAGHPVAAMLIAMFTISYALLIPPALAGLPLEPFLLGVIFLGQLLPAVLVTAAMGGRPAVRELFGRVFRWRVRVVWYLVALLAIPVVALLASAVLFGPGALRALVTDPAVILAYLNQLSILPLVNLWEETAWVGVVQARLAEDRGPLLAAVITGPLFGLVHLPLQLGKPFGELVISLILLMTFAIGLRIMIGWLYNVTAGSILLCAMVHVTFNATNNNNLLTAAAPGNSALEYIPWVVVAVLGLLVAVLTRGRLGPPAPALPEKAAAERAAAERVTSEPAVADRTADRPAVGERAVGDASG
jgi:membrane protease YdiL (CAAX protease family)